MDRGRAGLSWREGSFLLCRTAAPGSRMTVVVPAWCTRAGYTRVPSLLGLMASSTGYLIDLVLGSASTRSISIYY